MNHTLCPTSYALAEVLSINYCFTEYSFHYELLLPPIAHSFTKYSVQRNISLEHLAQLTTATSASNVVSVAGMGWYLSRPLPVHWLHSFRPHLYTHSPPSPPIATMSSDVDRTTASFHFNFVGRLSLLISVQIDLLHRNHSFSKR